MAKFEIRDLCEPKDGHVVRRGCFWICEDGDPNKALFYGDSPQCNLSERLCKHLCSEKYIKDVSNQLGRPVDLRVVHVEIAFMKQREQ